MPVRIKPNIYLPPCTLNLKGIQGIIELISKDSSEISCSAVDGVWEIYSAKSDEFLETISKRDKLDSLEITGQVYEYPFGHPDEGYKIKKQIKIVFSAVEASVSLLAHPDEENWFEHFLIDLKKLLLPPTFSQRFSFSSGGLKYLSPKIELGIVGVGASLNPSFGFSTPYCRIILQKTPPDPFWENVKANLASNIIWAILVFLFGVILTLITTGQLKMPENIF